MTEGWALDCRQRQKIFVLSTLSRLDMGPIQPPVLCAAIQWMDHEFYHFLQLTWRLKHMELNLQPPIRPYSLYLIKHKVSFMFTFTSL